MNPERLSKLTSALRQRQPDLTVLMEQVYKWAYPRVARHYQERGTPYPPLSPDGGFEHAS
jgi:hypothetical protein